MGNNQSSSNKNANIKEQLEEIYNQVLSQKHIEETIQNEYCSKLVFVLKNDVLEKYAKDVLGDEAKKISLGTVQPNVEKGALCDKLSHYYMKKINLIGTIINSIRLAHLKLERINSGGLCYGGDKSMKATGASIPIQPTLPFKIGTDIEPIFVSQDLLENRKKVLKRANIEDASLLEYLSLIEIDNPQDCKKFGGQWLSTRADMEKAYLVPSDEVKEHNKQWHETLKKLETSTYEHIGKLVSSLDLLVEERIEPKMINGKEQRIKTYRDRLIYDKDLDSLVLKTKRQILDLFLDLDSYFLVLFSMRAISKEDIEEKRHLEERLKHLKKRGVK